jgi:hypothetical protein
MQICTCYMLAEIEDENPRIRGTSPTPANSPRHVSADSYAGVLATRCPLCAPLHHLYRKLIIKFLIDMAINC